VTDRTRTTAIILRITYYVLISLTTLSAVLQPPIISLRSSVTIETHLTSVYNTHVPGRTRGWSRPWNKHISTQSTRWGIKTHQNTCVHNFVKCWPILIEIGVLCLI